MDRQASRGRHLGDDERSEDSDTRKHTKTSIIKLGLSEVDAVHDDILRMHIEEIHNSGGTWLFRKQLHGEEYHSRHDPMGEDSTVTQ